MDKEKLNKDIIRALKQVYDPEIPVNVYDLGLIYGIDIDDDHNVTITMTLTAPNCPLVDELLADVKEAVLQTPGVVDASINVVFEPAWDKSMLSDEALLELGLL